MKKLRNWDNKTWLSSKKYISAFNNFLKLRIKLNKNTKILDIGCGRASIISALQKKYKFKEKAIGVDIVKNKNIKKNIIFKKIDALSFFKKTNTKFNLILIKQTIHFFNKNQIKSLISQAKNNLHKGGKLLIFSLKTKNNKIVCFKKMKINLNESLKRDELLFKIIKNNLKNSRESNFNFKVNISKKKYIKMIESRYISCLLNMNTKDLKIGLKELNLKFKNHIKFNDTLKCVAYEKN